MENFTISELEILYESQPKIHLDRVSPNLNIVYGHNESGKSRIKEFIEWMIFTQTPQFESLSPQAKKAAFQSTGQIQKGSLTVRNENESATISQQPSGSNAVASVSNSNLSIADLTHMLSDDISLAQFRSIFSLNLDALSREQSNNLLSEDKTAEVFLSAAQTGSGVSLSALVSELRDKKEDLFSESGNATKRQINKLLKDVSEIDKEIRQIRREQQTSLSYTSDTESLQREHLELKTRLRTIGEELANLLLTKNYSESYHQYRELVETQTPDFNSDLIGEIVNIKELLSQCEHHEGDEKTLNQLLLEKSEIQDLLNKNETNLQKTLDPNKAPEELSSHSFKTALELEKQASSKFLQDRSRTQELFDSENGELVRLTKRVDELTTQIETIESAKETQHSNATDNSFTKPKPKRKNLVLSISAIVLGVILTGASIFLNQPIGIVSGVILIGFGATLRLMKAPVATENKNLQSTTVESLEASNIGREIDGLYSEIRHKEAQVEIQVNALKELEKSRTLAKQAFTNKITALGFDSNLDPIHIELYIDDLDKYQNQQRLLRDIEARSQALSTWFENFFDSIASLQEKTRDTRCETHDQITTISHARTWLETVLELTEENKEIEKQLHERESEIRTLEKSLVAQFSSIEKAKTHFETFSPLGLEERIANTTKLQHELEEKLSNLDQEIGSIRKAAEHAGQETQMQDRLLTRESLVRELEEAHAQYATRFTAYKAAENAFAKCQRESQPEVLQKASAFLGIATNGNWNSISIDLVDSSRSKSRDVEMTVSNDRETLNVLKLSQGTQEQLYLSLRLALMECSPRGQHIPALFDDVAVNADRNRFASIAPLISKIADSRQVFYFTCHEWVRDELAKFENARVLDIN